MMSLYFFTGIFFTLSLNAFFTQLANDFVAGVLSIVGSDQLGRGGLVQTSMGTTLMRMEWQIFATPYRL